MCKIHVVIADDNSIFRRGLSNVLKDESEIIILAEVTNGIELIDVVEQYSPDIVLTDIQMPLMNGIEAISIISKKAPEVNAIALSMYDDEELIRKILSAGAKGYLLKNEDKEEIVNAIKTVYKKEAYYSKSIISNLLFTKSQNFHNRQNKFSFSKKELSVMKMICDEYSSKEIACKLGMSVRSVEHAKERVQHKIGAKNMVGIALFAVRNLFVSLNSIPSGEN